MNAGVIVPSWSTLNDCAEEASETVCASAPFEPGFPCGPCEPVGPAAPVAPVSPCGPVAPVEPAAYTAQLLFTSGLPVLLFVSFVDE